MDGYGIVFCWPYSGGGGVPNLLLKAAVDVRRRRPEARIGVVAPRCAPQEILSGFRRIGAEVLLLEHELDGTPYRRTAQRFRRRVRNARVHRELVQVVDRHFPHAVVHADITPWFGAAALHGLLRHHRVVSIFHSAVPSSSRWRDVLLAAKLATLRLRTDWCVTASTTAARRSFANALGRDVDVAVYGADPEELERAIAVRVRAEANRSDGRSFLLVGVGQLIDRKGVAIAIDAIARLRSSGYDVMLGWVGEGPDRALLQERVSSLSLGEHVTLRSWFPDRPGYLQFLASADIYLQPSLQEGLPSAMLEAMGLGLAVVATNVDAIPEAVIDGVNGLLVDPGDVATLTAAISRLLDDDASRTRLGAAARETVLDRFDIHNGLTVLFDAYTESSDRGRKTDRIVLAAADTYLQHAPMSSGQMRLARSMRARAIRSAAGRPVRCRDGRWVYADLRTGMCVDTYFTRRYEPALTEIFESIVRSGDTCVDVGACFGWYTTLFAECAGPRGRVFAIEPNPPALRLLRSTLGLNGYTNITVSGCAVGERRGRGHIAMPDSLEIIGHAVVRPHGGEAVDEMSVLIVPLDELVHGHVDVMKVDIEGSELSFLHGARATLAASRPWIVAEMATQTSRRFGYQPNDLLDELGTYGYKFYAVDEVRARLRPLVRFASDDIGANVLCLPFERALPPKLARWVHY